MRFGPESKGVSREDLEVQPENLEVSRWPSNPDSNLARDNGPVDINEATDESELKKVREKLSAEPVFSPVFGSESAGSPAGPESTFSITRKAEAGSKPRGGFSSKVRRWISLGLVALGIAGAGKLQAEDGALGKYFKNMDAKKAFQKGGQANYGGATPSRDSRGNTILTYSTTTYDSGGTPVGGSFAGGSPDLSPNNPLAGVEKIAAKHGVTVTHYGQPYGNSAVEVRQFSSDQSHVLGVEVPGTPRGKKMNRSQNQTVTRTYQTVNGQTIIR